MKIILCVALIIVTLAFSACGSSAASSVSASKSEIACYLKWSDGEEKISLDHYIIGAAGNILLYTTDGEIIETGLANVIIIKKP